MGLALGMNLKFYTSVAKGLKLRLKTFWRLIPKFAEVTRDKLVEGEFCAPASPQHLNRVNLRPLMICFFFIFSGDIYLSFGFSQSKPEFSFYFQVFLDYSAINFLIRAF